MKATPDTLIPIAAALGLAGWACWPYLAPGPPPPASRAEPPKLAAGLLAPDLGAPPRRDPFRAAGDPPPVAPTAPAAGGAKAKPDEGPLARVRAILARAAAAAEAEARRKLEARLKAEALAEARRRGLAGLELTATAAGGPRRFATIAGRVYAEGEPLEGIDAALGPVVLAEVRPRGVTLRAAETPVALEFSSSSSSRASGAGPAPAAMPGPSSRPRPAAGRRKGR